MKKQFLIILFISFTLFTYAQDTINLAYEKSTDVNWLGGQKDYCSEQ